MFALEGGTGPGAAAAVRPGFDHAVNLEALSDLNDAMLAFEAGQFVLAFLDEVAIVEVHGSAVVECFRNDQNIRTLIF